MVSTLAVVVILGIIVTIAISNGPSSPNTTVAGGTGAGTTTTTSVKSIGTEAKYAAVSSCLGNFATVSAALATYKALESAAPPAGTSWATTSTNGGALLQSWPTDAPYYVITWNGITLSVVPRRGVASHGTQGTSSPRTGCYAA
jgi:hypothetical protein